jgi:hypothetical protein
MCICWWVRLTNNNNIVVIILLLLYIIHNYNNNIIIIIHEMNNIKTTFSGQYKSWAPLYGDHLKQLEKLRYSCFYKSLIRRCMAATPIHLHTIQDSSRTSYLRLLASWTSRNKWVGLTNTDRSSPSPEGRALCTIFLLLLLLAKHQTMDKGHEANHLKTTLTACNSQRVGCYRNTKHFILYDSYLFFFFCPLDDGSSTT